VVASDADGRPNFARLHVRWTRPGTIHLWAFDLLAFNDRDRANARARRAASRVRVANGERNIYLPAALLTS